MSLIDEIRAWWKRGNEPKERPTPPPEVTLPADLHAPNPAPLPPTDASAGPGATELAQTTVTFPTGTVTSQRPVGGQPFNIPWSNLTRWTPQIEAALSKYPDVRHYLGADTLPFYWGLIAIESNGHQVWPAGHPQAGQIVEGGDTYGGGTAKGLMQIKNELHQWMDWGADWRTPEGNIQLGTAFLNNKLAIRSGDWAQVIRLDYHPGTSPGGVTPESYVRALRDLIAEAKAKAGPVIEPPPDPEPDLDPWRPYPYPKMVDLIVPKPYDGAGFDRVEFRRPLIRGFCTHITDGPQTQAIEFFRDFFGTGGQRQYDALTDLVIGADGRIGLLNDWRDPNRGGTRAGWANGGTDGLEGPGVAFYRRFPRINVHLVSCEHAAKAGQAWTDAEIASTIEIRTAIAQELKCPWESYPVHPAWGVSIEQAHTFFAAKSCPANPYLSTLEPIILAEVQKKLRAHQTGSVNGDPVPVPEPEPVKTYTDFGFTLETVANFFGVMRRHNADGTVDDLPFDPNGPLSLLWLERAEKEGKFPEAESIQTLDSNLWAGKERYATWEGGWVAVLPQGDTRASWMWLDEIDRSQP